MKNALIVVDFQNDIVAAADPGAAARAADAICALISARREAGADIIFTLDTHPDARAGARENGTLPPHCRPDTDGWRLYGGVGDSITTDDAVFIKSAFGSLELGVCLRDAGYDRVELCGAAAETAVLSNALIAAAALPDAAIAVAADALLFSDAAARLPALELLSRALVSAE